MGAGLVYFFLLPVAIKFFYTLAQSTGTPDQQAIQLMPDIEAYLDFVTMLILAFGLCFQLPVILTLLGQVGIVSYDQLKRGRKFAIVGVFIVAAVLTPPDPISQIAMAIPLMGLYEVSVQAVRLLEHRRAKADAARDTATST
jgi:sec-independent protein translocase protein TatC